MEWLYDCDATEHLRSSALLRQMDVRITMYRRWQCLHGPNHALGCLFGHIRCCSQLISALNLVQHMTDLRYLILWSFRVMQ